MDTLRITTPEGIAFSLRLAGPVTRCVAWIIDLIIIFALSKAIHSVLSVLKFFSPDMYSAALMLAYFVISIGYGIATEWLWRGQTIGKRLLRIRVMDEQGLRLQFSQVVVRNLLRFVDHLPAFYMVGGISCLMTQNAQRLGDIAASTVVVWNPRISMPDLDQLFPDKYNSLRAYPHLAARLRQRVSPQEADIALQALLRRNKLEPEARIALFHDIANHYKAITPFPELATEGVSDEQYVRNAAEILFQEKKC